VWRRKGDWLVGGVGSREEGYDGWLAAAAAAAAAIRGWMIGGEIKVCFFTGCLACLHGFACGVLRRFARERIGSYEADCEVEGVLGGGLCEEEGRGDDKGTMG